MSERTQKAILQELIEEADFKYIYDSVLSCKRGLNDPKFNAERVGELIKNLPIEEREKLKDLKAEDIVQRFAAYRRPRPETAITRKRGPVTHSKSKPYDDD